MMADKFASEASKVQSLLHREIKFVSARTEAGRSNKTKTISQQLGAKTLNGNKKKHLVITINGIKNGHSSYVDSSEDEADSLDASENSKQLFDFKIIEQNLKWNYTTGAGPGIMNAGNSCFINSTIQCLAYAPPIAQLICRGDLDDLCKAKESALFAFVRLIKRIVKASKARGKRKCLTASWFVRNLRRISKTMRVGSQHDAHEFLRCLTDSLQLDCLRAKGLKNDGEKGSNTTFVHGIFGGMLESQVRCQHCDSVSKTEDPFLDLSLDINKAQSIEDALRQFSSKEILDVDNQWLCNKCNRRGNCEKRMLLKKAPSVLVIHMKRFGYGRYSRKISRHTSFSSKLVLKRNTFSEPGSMDMEYSLYGVLVHSGHTPSSGHYLCYVKASNGVWYEIDDVTVCQVGIKTVLSQRAYMLFYHQVPPDVDLASFAKSFAVTSAVGIKAIAKPNNSLFGNFLGDQSETQVVENGTTKDETPGMNRSEPYLPPLALPKPWTRYWRNNAARTKRISLQLFLNSLVSSKLQRKKLILSDESDEAHNDTTVPRNDTFEASDSESSQGSVDVTTQASDTAWEAPDEIVQLAPGRKRKRNSGVKKGAWNQFVKKSAKGRKGEKAENRNSYRYDNWDKLLDQGRLKKVKSSEENGFTKKGNQFQKVAERKKNHKKNRVRNT
mmetsp:Transcript_7615/g.9930  ORF Transcript_7615/g.9930 Transcript_7615/m.9930 type:complete len:668 (-) Transcript_7615:462-2465(-)